MSGQPNALIPEPNQPGQAPNQTAGQPGPIGAGTETDASKLLPKSEVNAIVQARIAETAASIWGEIRQKFGDPDTLKMRLDKLAELERQGMTELDRAKQDLDAERALRAQEAQKTKDAELRAMRLEVGQTKGLSALLSARLQGDTREAMEADADAVLADLTARARPTPPNLHAGAGVGESSQRQRQLTPGQEAAMRAAKMTREQYMKALDDMEGAKGG